MEAIRYRRCKPLRIPSAGQAFDEFNGATSRITARSRSSGNLQSGIPVVFGRIRCSSSFGFHPPQMPGMAGLSAPFRGAQCNGRNDDQSGCQVLVERIDIQDVETVVDQGEQHDAGDRSPDCTYAAVSAGAAKDDGRDGLQLMRSPFKVPTARPRQDRRMALRGYQAEG